MRSTIRPVAATVGNPVHRPSGRRDHAHPVGLGHRRGGRAPAGLGKLRRGFETFQCATAVVPLDYDRPRGRQVTLALAGLPASDPGRRIGSLFLNPGGPGGSGVDWVLGAGPFLYSDEVRARFDLVGFDMDLLRRAVGDAKLTYAGYS